jgi:hypothetical protein
VPIVVERQRDARMTHVVEVLVFCPICSESGEASPVGLEASQPSPNGSVLAKPPAPRFRKRGNLEEEDSCICAFGCLCSS